MQKFPKQPAFLPPEEGGGPDDNRPSHDYLQDVHFSVSGARHLTKPDYPLPKDPHAGPGPDAGKEIDSRFDETAIANDSASREWKKPR